jgi:hypothetical protein
MEIVNEAGLPVPKFDKPGDPLGTVAAGRLHDWIELYGDHVAAGLVDRDGLDRYYRRNPEPYLGDVMGQRR